MLSEFLRSNNLEILEGVEHCVVLADEETILYVGKTKLDCIKYLLEVYVDDKQK